MPSLWSKYLSRGELGDSLGALRDGVLGEFSWESKSDSGLDLSGRQGGLLVVDTEFSGLRDDFVEDVRDEGVHHHHGLLGDADFCKNKMNKR